MSSVVSDAPVFAVIGHVNKGKSSVVATLTEDDTVPIADSPGTTRTCREFPVQVDGQTLFTILDTPGFEQAPRALDWLRAREKGAASRPGVVADFVEAHSAGDDFIEECRLLAPVVGVRVFSTSLTVPDPIARTMRLRWRSCVGPVAPGWR